MKNALSLGAVAALALSLSGCFTLDETAYPETRLTGLGEGRDMKVQVSGFEATITSYVPVYGYETVYRTHCGYGRHRRGWGGLSASTYSTTTYVPRIDATSAFVERATDALEKSGFTVSADGAQYRVDVKFSGPMVSGTDLGVEAAWFILSAFSASYGTQTWTAQLKIYDLATGKLAMHNDYVQRYQATVWGPIPLFSPACADLTTDNAMQSWCLTALTDRAMADATAFLAAK